MSQALAALSLAERRRQRLSELKVLLKSGDIDLHTALLDPATANQRVAEVLEFLPGRGRYCGQPVNPRRGRVPRARAQAQRMMRRLGTTVSEYTLCGKLTDRQRQLVCLTWQAELATWPQARQ